MKIFRSFAFCIGAASINAHAGLTEGIDAFHKYQYLDARKELTDLASAGDAEAMAVMGEMLMRGLGGARDELKAREYILQAREKGSLRATYTLGRMHLYGNLVGKDEAKGVELVKEAATKAYAPAQSLFGSWIASGTFGLEKSDAIALLWLKQAADQKDPLGMLWLGAFYEGGKAGLPQDNLVALDWYKKAGELRETSAMVSAGRIYALGLGVTADGTEALRWFRLAANLGNYRSYTWIASVYEFGRGGIAKNLSLAYSWYAAVPANALANDVKAATEGKERLAKVLSQAERDEAAKQSKVVVVNELLNRMGAIPAGGSVATASRKGVYGSGVVVSRNGDILTNDHVIQNCANVRIQPTGAEVKVIAKDAKNDLALLRMEGSRIPAIKLRTGRGIRLGDDLVVVGYPLRGLLSSGPIVTTGIVNALSGFNDDTSAFQMSATVQPGSSGGPVVDSYGLLVGIVRARLLPGGPISAQNVNFGINLATVSGFLDAHNVDYSSVQPNGKAMNVGDITLQAQKPTVQIECY
jgi:TPR repeat protein